MLRRGHAPPRGGVLRNEHGRPDPRPIAQPRTRVSLRWSQWPRSSYPAQPARLAPAPHTWSVPSDFVVPAAFPTRSARSSDSPVGGDAAGGHRLGGRLSPTRLPSERPAARAERLVAQAHRFLEKGFYLFRSSNIRHRGPRRPRRAVRAASGRDSPTHGTNGWNYDIGPDSIVAWLEVLERDHVRLTGWVDWWRPVRSTTTTRRAGPAVLRVLPRRSEPGNETVDAWRASSESRSSSIVGGLDGRAAIVVAFALILVGYIAISPCCAAFRRRPPTATGRSRTRGPGS